MEDGTSKKSNSPVDSLRAFGHLPRYVCRPPKARKGIESCATVRFQGGVDNDKFTLFDTLLLGFTGIKTDDPSFVSAQRLVFGRGDNPIQFYALKTLTRESISVPYFYH